MILAIDIGNSSMTIGLYTQEGQLTFCASVKTEKDGTKDQCALDLLGVFGLYGAEIKKVSGAIVSSVVPPLTAAISDAIALLIGKAPLIVGPGLKTGMNIRAETHNQLGADIVASSVAALHKYPEPLIVIDMGTATTLSVLIGSTYEGCVIIPGMRIAVEALSQRTAELPHISIEVPPSILGRNTIDAMRSGAFYGHVAMLDSMIVRLEKASKPAATVVMTGKNATTIWKYCARKIQYDPNLRMDGLYLLYQKNADRQKKFEIGA